METDEPTAIEPQEPDEEVAARPSIMQGDLCWARTRDGDMEVTPFTHKEFIHQFLPAIALQQKHPITNRPQRLLLSQCQWCLGVVTSWLA